MIEVRCVSYDILCRYSMDVQVCVGFELPWWMVEITGIVRCLSGVVGTNVIVLEAYLARSKHVSKSTPYKYLLYKD